MSKTILLADDSVTIQKVIELTFMDEDYEVIAAGDGDEALDRLEELSPDVVIADVHMPGASGFDVARRSRQLHPTVPVLLLVGTFEPFDESDYEASGADSYLKKPFDSQELLQRVTSLLESAPAAPEAAAAEPVPPPPTASEGEEMDDDFGSAATRAVPSLGSFGDERVQAAPEPAADEIGSAGFRLEADDEPAPAVGGGEPFPELSSPRRALSDDDDLFGFSEADGSSQVLPPPDMAEPAAEEVPLAPEQDDEVASVEELTSMDELSSIDEMDVAAGAEADDTAGYDSALEPEEVVAPPAMADEPTPYTPGLGHGAAASPAEALPETASSGVEPPAAAAAGAGLSDGDVDRIARRVVELLGDRAVREVAWEVVPDLAEVVIKDRLRELESQID